MVEVGERRARMAQQGELQGAAKLVRITTAFCHEAPVGSGQGKQACQGVGVGRDAQERLALLVGQQLSACQSVSPVPQTSMMNMDRPALGDVVCGRFWPSSATALPPSTEQPFGRRDDRYFGLRPRLYQ